MILPNQLSLVRILLIPLFLVAVAYIGPQGNGARGVALALFGLAVVTDGIDGFLARLRKERTDLGAYLDALADKLLLSAAFIALSMQENLAIRPPVWVPIILISRDAILILGCAIISNLKGGIKIVPSLLGKLTTVIQMTAVFLILIEHQAAVWAWHAAVILTVCSGLAYIWRGRSFLDQPSSS